MSVKTWFEQTGDFWDRMTPKQRRQLDHQTVLMYGRPAREVMDEAAANLHKLERTGHPVRLPSRGLERVSHAMAKKVPPFGPREPESRVPDELDRALPDPTCSTETPPPAPSLPAVFYRLGPSSMDAYLRRRTSVDVGLALHCRRIRAGYSAESARLRAMMDETRWPFPTFAPRARPFDWTVDEGL
ncbi:MAG: hypothetical protein ACRDPE_19690 [Solirubrobacterales bacterium]